MHTPFLPLLCNNRVHFFIFQAEIYKNIIKYFIRKSMNAYAVAATPLFFSVNFRNLIFTIKIFSNFVKPILKSITLFHPANTNFETVIIQCSRYDAS